MAYPCRLRAYRKSRGLSQRELALLLGLRSQSLIAAIESGKKRPGIDALLACHYVFDEPLQTLFPDLARGVARNVRSRAERLLSREKNRLRPRAQAHLSKLINRLTPHHQPI